MMYVQIDVDLLFVGSVFLHMFSIYDPYYVDIYKLKKKYTHAAKSRYMQGR